MLQRLIRQFRSDSRADRLYGQIVAQARQPVFYARYGVADTAEGRFDMIVLHVVLVMRRLRETSADGRALAQALFDTFFADMDRNLREMGTSDLSVPKKVRAMVEAFYGRAAVYDTAIEAASLEGMCAALDRNLFAGKAAGPDGARADSATETMARYVLACGERLADLSYDDIRSGRLDWAVIEETAAPEPAAGASGEPS